MTKIKKQSFIPEFVYGSMDGLVTTFAIVTSAVGASLSPGIILIVGFANVFADAFSMGASSYLAAKTEEEHHEHTHSKKPTAKSVVTFVSFVIVGMVPLVPYLAALVIPSFSSFAVATSVGMTLVAFFTIGYASGALTGQNPWVAALRSVTIGGIAAVIAFSVGRVLAVVFGV